VTSLLANTTFLALLVSFAVVLTGWCAGWNSVATLRKLRAAFTMWPVVVVLLLGGIFNSAFRIYIGSLNPGDFMADVVAARQLLNHQFMYPPHIGFLIDQEMSDHPPIMEFRQAPKWMDMDARTEHATIKMNAHPPFVGMLVALALRFVTFRWVYLLLTLFTSAALVGMILICLRGLEIPFTRNDFLALTGLAFGWHPVLSTLRSGQTSILIAGCMTLGWFLLRQKKPGQAGVWVGVATAVKLYPGLLIIYFMLRSWRAFLSSVATLLGIQVLTIVVCGMLNFRAFLYVVRFLSQPFYSRTNMSAVAFVSGFLKMPWITLLVVGSGIAVLAYWVATRKKLGRAENLDLEYSLCMVMQLLLTPIAWSHYLTVLILPLAVLGNHVFRSRAQWSAIAAYLGLALCFSIPDTTVKSLQIVIQESAGYYMGWILTSIFTVSLVLLWAWLALLSKKAATQAGAVPPSHALGARSMAERQAVSSIPSV
jgi:hypothetical protein